MAQELIFEVKLGNMASPTVKIHRGVGMKQLLHVVKIMVLAASGSAREDDPEHAAGEIPDDDTDRRCWFEEGVYALPRQSFAEAIEEYRQLTAPASGRGD